MIKEDKKITCFLLAIFATLVFTFTIADAVNTLSQTKTPWLYRTDRDLIKELRMELNNIQWAMASLAQENWELRELVYTTGPITMVTNLELMDECKRLQQKVDEQKTKIRILELKLRLRQLQIPAPYWRDG